MRARFKEVGSSMTVFLPCWRVAYVVVAILIAPAPSDGLGGTRFFDYQHARDGKPNVACEVFLGVPSDSQHSRPAALSRTFKCHAASAPHQQFGKFPVPIHQMAKRVSASLLTPSPCSRPSASFARCRTCANAHPSPSSRLPYPPNHSCTVLISFSPL